MNSLYIRSGIAYYTARTKSFQQIISKRDGQVQGGFLFNIVNQNRSYDESQLRLFHFVYRNHLADFKQVSRLNRTVNKIYIQLQRIFQFQL